MQDAPSNAHISVCALLLHPAWLPIPLLFPDALATMSGSVLTFQDHVCFVLIDVITRFPPTPRIVDSNGAAKNSWWDSLD